MKGRLDKDVSHMNSGLSLGESKRVELLRVLLKDYEIILLDEPTSNLDENNLKVIIELLKNIKDKTVIVTSHENGDEFLELFDVIVDYSNIKPELSTL